MMESRDNVNAMVDRIERYQKSLIVHGKPISDQGFVARYQRYLGSSKTWRDRLCARKWDEFGASIVKWEQKLRAFVAEIDGTSDISEYMEALPIAKYGTLIYDTLQGQKSDRRVAWLIGPTGVGKSWTMRKLAADNVGESVYLHVNRGAKDSLLTIAAILARGVAATVASSGAGTFANVVEALKANPLTLIIDDIHDGGVLMLKLVKHLVDDTRAKLILGTYPSAWNALVNGSTDAHSEAQQLLGRSLKPVERRWLKGVTEADVASYLKAAMGGSGESKALAQRITPVIQRHGNLRALADAVELARMNADESGDEVTAELIDAAVREICPPER